MDGPSLLSKTSKPIFPRHRKFYVFQERLQRMLKFSEKKWVGRARKNRQNFCDVSQERVYTISHKANLSNVVPRQFLECSSPTKKLLYINAYLSNEFELLYQANDASH